MKTLTVKQFDKKIGSSTLTYIMTKLGYTFISLGHNNLEDKRKLVKTAKEYANEFTNFVVVPTDRNMTRLYGIKK